MKGAFSILFIFFYLSTCSDFTKNEIVDSQSRKAVCNDGSSGIYYVSRTSSKNWIVHLDGGGGCSTVEQCKSRWENERYLMTSNGRSMNETRSGGVFSSDCYANPAFCTWNKVYIVYCSSDRHLGNREKSEETGNFHFQGYNIVMSTIEDLAFHHNMNEAEKLVLSGDSAGGEGVWNVGDDVIDYLKDISPALNDYRILSGSGWFLDGKGISGGGSFEKAVKLGKELWNYKAHKKCHEKYGDEDHLCLVGHIVYPFVESKKMVVIYVFDKAQSGYDAIYKNSIQELSGDERNWINKRGKFVQETLVDLKVDAVFAVGCWQHDILPSWQGQYNYHKTLDGINTAQAVEEWMKTGKSFHVDFCDDLDCNPTC